MSENEAKEAILKNPPLTCYSVRRYLAAIVVFRTLACELEQEGKKLPENREMVRVFLQH
ncbi:MAG: hypothetical protein N3E51_01490 [Candidatus Micrarchaeota archaeon]|nr:hypothetical protein [Candidatus Micrarchaeota archaeon]